MSAMAAEIPDAEAALAFARQSASVPDFDALFDALEAAQIRLGIEGRLRCWVMLSRLAGLGVRFDDAAVLTSHLLPVLAGTAHERRDVRRLIEEWLKSVQPGALHDQGNAVQIAVPAPVRQLEQAERTGRVVTLGLAIAAGTALAAIIAYQVIGDDTPTVVKTATNVVSYKQSVVSLDFGLDPFWKDLLENLLSRLGFAAVVVALGLSYAAWRGEVKGRLVRRVGEADLVQTFSLTAEPPGWFRTVDARAAFDRLKRVRWADTDQIDVPETVARSTRSGGLPVIVNRRLRELPNYVLLVDRAADGDHASLFAREVEAALAEARIVYSRYDFSGTLDRLNPVRSRRGGSVVDRENLPFSVVATRHTGERMILVGSGTEFFEMPGVRLDRSGRRIVVRPGTPRANLIHLREFSSASLFTSAPYSAWGEHERRLSDAGFALYSADVRGVENLAAQLIHEVDAPSSNLIAEESSDIEQFLHWLDHNELRLASDVPPDSDEIALLVHNLRIWSGPPEVFTLLAGIAAFPKIDPGFTFVLAGFILNPKPAGDEAKATAKAKGEKKPAIDSALFGRLVRLPWIRNGRMPDWLRIGLVNALRPPQRELIRQIQMFMLAQAEDARTGDHPLPSTERLVALFEIARESAIARTRLDDVASRIPPGDLVADERIFFSVLRGEKLDPVEDVIQPEAPEIVAHRMEEPERQRRTRLRHAVFGIAAAVALLQPWILDVGNGALNFVLRALVIAAAPAIAVPGWMADSAIVGLMLLALGLWLFNMMRAEPRPLPLLRSWLRPSVPHLLDPRAPALLAVCLSPLMLKSPLPLAVILEGFGTNLISGGERLIAPLAVLGWVWLVGVERWWSEHRADDFLHVQLQRDWMTGTLGLSAAVMVWALPWFLTSAQSIYETTGAQMLIVALVAGIANAASIVLWRRWVFGITEGALQRIWLDLTWGMLTCLVVRAMVLLVAPMVDSSGTMSEATYVFAIRALSLAGYYANLRAGCGARADSTVWRPTVNAMCATVLAVTWLGVSSEFLGLDDALISPGNPFGRDLAVLVVTVDLVGSGILVGTAILATRQLRPSHDWRTLASGIVMTMLVYSAASGSAMLGWLQYEVMTRSITQTFGYMIRPDPDLVTSFWLFTLPATLACWSALTLIARAASPDHAQPARLWLRSVLENPWWAVPIMWVVAIGWQFGDRTLCVWPLALPVAVAFAWKHGEGAFAAIAVGTLPLVVQLSDNPSTGPFLTPGGVWPAIAILFWAHFVADATFRQRLLRRETLPWFEAAFIIVPLMMQSFGTPNLPDTMASLRVNPDWMAMTVALVIGASRVRATPIIVVAIAAWTFWTALDLLPTQGAEFFFRNHDIGRLVSFLTVLYAARAWRRYAVGFDRENASRNLHEFIRANRQQTEGIALVSLVALMVAVPFSGWAPLMQLGGFGLLLEPTMAAELALVGIAGLVACRARDRSAYYADLPGGWMSSYARAVAAVPFLPFLLAPAFMTMGYLLLLYLVEPLEFAGLRFDAMPFAFPRDIQYASVAGCAVVFVLFGVALRIAGERRSDESLRDAAGRLWGRPREIVAEDAAASFSEASQPGQRERQRRAGARKTAARK